MRARAARFVRRRGSLVHVYIDPCAPAQPKRRNKAMMRRTHTLVKPRVKYVMDARFPISARVGYGIITPKSVRILLRLVVSSAQVAINSPAPAPTMEAPRIRPLRSVTTLM